MEVSSSYSLKWNNHTENVLRTVEDLFQSGSLTDMSLAVTDSPYTIKCHKMVLVACSTYLRDVILRNESKHVGEHLVICLEGVKYDEIKTLLEYMYNGEVNVVEKDLKSLLSVARRLKVKGLEMANETHMRDATTEESLDSNQHSVENTYDYYDKSSSMEGVRSSMAFGSQWNGPVFPTSRSRSNVQPPLHQPGLAGSYESDMESSPLKLKKYSTLLMHRALLMGQDSSILKSVLDQNYPDSSHVPSYLPTHNQQPPQPQQKQQTRRRRRSCSNSSTNDQDTRSNKDVSASEAEQTIKTETELSHDQRDSEQAQSPTRDGRGGYPHPHKKWKRYKKYSQNNLEAALMDVKNGVQTLKAALNHGVPSRTLYDKIKRLGIKRDCPVKRGFKNTRGDSNHSNLSSTSSACFPYGIGRNVDGSIYNNRVNYSDSDNEHVSTNPNHEENDTGTADRSSKTPDLSNEITQSDVHSSKRHSPKEDDAEDLSIRSTPDASSTMIKEEVVE